MTITTVGLDIAKQVIQVHAVDVRGKPIIRKQLKRHQVLPFFANLPPCLIGIEACGGAHDWARRLMALGHTVKLMAPQFVKPYVKANKHDAADAEAICEAVSRPSMRFVSVKAQEQQALLALHRARQGFVTARTAQANQLRGLLAEFGLVVPKGLAALKRRIPDIPGGCGEWASRSVSGTAPKAGRPSHRTESPGGRPHPAHRGRAPGEPLVPPARPNPRHRPTDRHGSARRDRRHPGVRQRPATGGLAGPGTEAVFDRRQDPNPRDQQARGHLSSDTPDPWGALGSPCRSAKRGTRRHLADAPSRSAPPEHRGGGLGQQECTNRFRAAGP